MSGQKKRGRPRKGEVRLSRLCMICGAMTERAGKTYCHDCKNYARAETRFRTMLNKAGLPAPATSFKDAVLMRMRTWNECAICGDPTSSREAGYCGTCRHFAKAETSHRKKLEAAGFPPSQIDFKVAVQIRMENRIAEEEAERKAKGTDPVPHRPKTKRHVNQCFEDKWDQAHIRAFGMSPRKKLAPVTAEPNLRYARVNAAG